MSLRKWYFCINEKGFDRTRDLMRAAVASCRANTELRPVCVYNGGNEDQVALLASLGVEVVRHRSSFEADLRAGYGEAFDTFSGHWLRIDLPLIEQEDELVLYTDIDVIFVKPPLVERVPRYLAAAPEFDRANLSYFSSGVMLMNLPGLREVLPRFVGAIRARLRGDFRYPAHDQESFNRFFRRTYDPMSPAMNWKPFWGVNEDARIVHFHGPKPVHAELFAKGKGERISETYRRLWSQSPEAYAHYGAQFRSYLPPPEPKAARERPAKARAASA